MKSVKNFSASSEKEHGVLIHAAWIGNIVMDTASSYFSSGNSVQTFLRYICVEKFFVQGPNFSMFMQVFMGTKEALQCLASHNLAMEP